MYLILLLIPVTAAVVKEVAVAAVVEKTVAVVAVAGGSSPVEASDVPGTALVVAYNSAGWRG